MTPNHLARLIGQGEDWDLVEEQSALDALRASMFSTSHEPFALSRYIMLEPLGSGGAGIVYRAYDPQLHRQVAVKVLRTREGSTVAADSARLLREAQAIAQLNHTNIVSVFDVGTLDEAAAAVLGPGVFMVMELVDGKSLREWVAAQPRQWPALLEVFIAAGRGLQAAHAQGIVHRDFKPTNVLVGDDGRVKVLDFGLALAVEAPVDPASADRPQRDQSRDDDGAVLGTPCYMAPEQHVGQPCDARTDQYCFCVALHEALNGERPFCGATLGALAAAKKAGPPPLRGNIPGKLSDAIVRGLAVAPEDRFESMSALLDVLDRAPARGRKQALWVGSMVVAGLGAYAVAGQATPPPSGCESPSGRLVGVWDSDSRAQAKQAFASTGLAYANDTFESVASALDDYATTWESARLTTCEATVVDGHQAPEAMALQMLCLDRQFEGFAELARLLVDADEPVVRNALSATTKLRAPVVCRDASRRLELRLDLDGHERAAMLALDAQLLRASVLSDAGKYDESGAVAQVVLHRAEGLDARRAQARAHLLLCRLDWLTSRYVAAQKHCEAALTAAERGQSDTLAFEVLSQLGRVTANLGTYGEAQRVYSIARARLESIPQAQRPDMALAILDEGMGLLRDYQWRGVEARQYLERALSHYEAHLGDNHPELVSVLNGLGMAAAGDDRYAAARGYYERALKISRSAYGPRHPHVGALLNNLGGVEIERGRFQAALRLLSASLELKQNHLGTDSPRLVTTLGRLGYVLAETGHGEAALVHHQRAVRIQEQAQGHDSHLLVDPLLKQVRTLRLLNRCGDAETLIERVVELAEVNPEALRSSGGALDFERAQCAKQAGETEAALAGFERALATESQNRGHDGRQPAAILIEVAELLEARGDLVGARARLADAHRRCKVTEGDPELLRRVESARARVLAVLRDQVDD